VALIRLDKVAKFYRSEETVSVGMKNISLTFDLGEFVAVTGESGSGKSTLLNVVSGLDGYEEGELYLFNEETSHYNISDWEKYRSAYIGFVFQNYNIIDSYTVYQNVMLALEVQGFDRKQRKQRALELIEQVGLTSHKNHKASKLSGGQKQRAVIARALAKDCPIIVADEPTGNLDSKSAEQVMKLLHDISENKLVIVVTHDFEQVENYATRKIKMHDGEVTEDRILKQAPEIVVETIPEPKKMSVLNLLRFAVRNLLSTPRKLFFLLFLQIIVISVFTIVYTNQISTLREQGKEQSSTYPMVTETRVLVEKRDGTAFSENEINLIRNNRYVNEVFTEAMNFYNENPLVLAVGTDFYRFGVSGTDSAKRLRAKDIEGRLPVAIDEIVVSDYFGRVELGNVVKINIGEQWYYDDENVVSIGTFTVVGLTKNNNNVVYFSDAYLNQSNSEEMVIDQQRYRQVLDNISHQTFVRIDGNEYHVSRDVNLNQTEDVYFYSYRGDQGSRTITNNASFIFTTYNTNYEEFHYTVNGLTYNHPDSIEDYGQLMITDALRNEIKDHFLNLFEPEYMVLAKKYISVGVDGYFAGNQVVKSLDLDTYRVYYPSNITSGMSEMLVFFFGFFAVIFLTLFGLFLYSIVHAVTKNVMAARKKDFAIYRAIGAHQSTLAQLVVVEQVILSVVGFIITMIILNIVASEVTAISTDMQYMQFTDYLILLLAFMFFGIWLGLRFNKRVFNQSVIETLSQSRGD